MNNPTYKNIQAGDIVQAGYRNHDYRCKFLGFTNSDQKYSENPVYKNTKEMYEDNLTVDGSRNCRRWSDLEDIQYTKEYGYHFYAIFQHLDSDGNGQFNFGAYLFGGRWVVGSSADKQWLAEDHQPEPIVDAEPIVTQPTFVDLY